MFYLWVALASLAVTAEPELTFEPVARHPTVNVTPADVERARKRIETDPQAKAWLESITKSLAAWKDKDATWVRAVMPDKGACFAYGFTGCPICGSDWGQWEKVRASFDKPGHVTCGKGHVLPDAEHPDPGTGFVGPDQRIHYFVGSYNAWVVEKLTFRIAEPYSTVYLLTRDSRAGTMAAVVLDEIARIYPSCDKGSWDYPSDPPSGRLNRPWYQVARVLVHYVDIYDAIHDHPALNEPSATEGLTRRQNIERNLLLNGAKYCYDEAIRQGGLHNGQADYLRGVLSVGIVLGIPKYVDWPVNGPYGIRAMLANNVDRDGAYFETSPNYGLHTRSLYLTFAEPLLNYRGSLFPDGLNLYDDPKFESFLLLPKMAMVCLGQAAPFGDMAPAVTQRPPPYHPPAVTDCAYTERLATRLSDPAKRAKYAALLKELESRDPKAAGRTIEWRVFHWPDPPPSGDAPLTDGMKRFLDGSFFYGQKGLAVLRRGDGAGAHAAVLRYGPSLVHGHLDDLNVNYFARGYEITYDIGYNLGSTHTQVGWAHQTASHNTVVVDEKSQGGGSTGGSLHHFTDLPGLTLVDASSTVYAHTGVDVYRRLIALTDEYALDVFRVRGGKQHDLPMHALATDVTFDNLSFGEASPGSLAGPEYEWGNLQLNDGDMKGHPNQPYWNPPPGNGYGFLVQPAWAEPAANWSATWLFKDKDDTRFRLDVLQGGEGKAISALAPGLYPTSPQARHVIRRRAGENLSSCFVSVWQVGTGGSVPVRLLRRIDSGPALSAGSAFAVAAELADGKRDVWAIGPSQDSIVTATVGDTTLTLRGAIGKCRFDGAELVSAHLLDGRLLEAGGWSVAIDSPDRLASVTGVPDLSAPLRSRLVIDADWPADERYDGAPLYVGSPRYTRNSPYVVRDIAGNTIRLEQVDTLIGQGVVHEIRDEHTLTTLIPHEYARSVMGAGPSDFFRGKMLRADDGTASATIRDVVFGDPMIIHVESTKGFRTGQGFRYHDVQPGDTVAVQHYAVLVREPPRTYRLRTNADVTLAAPGKPKIRYVDSTGQSVVADGGRIPRHTLPTSGSTTITLGDEGPTTATAPAESHRDQLIRRFDECIVPLVEAAIQKPGTNAMGLIAWGQSYLLAALAEILDATRDPKYADLFIRLGQWVADARDDRHDRKDEYRGRIVPAWGSTKYTQGKHYSWAVHTGMIAAPMAQFATVVRRDKKLSEKYGKEADRFLTIAQEAVAVHDDQRREGPGPEEGYVYGLSIEKHLPLNMQNALVRAWIWLDDATGKPEHREWNTRLARFLKNRLRTTDDGAYVWAYRTPLDGPGDGFEDISHAAINVDFMVLCAERKIVFTPADLAHLEKTLLNKVLSDDGPVADTIGGSPRTNKYSAAIARWGALARHSEAVRDRLVKLVLAGKFKGDAAEPLGIAYLVSALPPDLRYKDRLLAALAADIPKILKTFDAASGRFGEGIWTCNDQHAMYPLAVAYRTEGNPYNRDAKILDVIVKAGDALIQDADERGQWVFRKKDGSTWGNIWMPWTYSRWVRSFLLIRDDMAPDRREAWAKALILGYEGISRSELKGVQNIPAHHAMGLYFAGKALDRPDWCQQAAEFLAKVAAAQAEGGYWSENVGPVVGYSFVYMDALGTYYGASGDRRVAAALERGSRFHRHFTYPDGGRVETVDERNPYNAGVDTGNVGFTFCPDGRRYLQEQWSRRGEDRLGADMIASLLLYGQEGPMADLSAESGGTFVLSDGGKDRAAVWQSGPWFVCLSAYTAPVPKSRWIQDRQNLVSIYHEKTGLILGGGNTKLQPAWSNFTVGDMALLAHKPGDTDPDFLPKGELYHVPSAAALVREPVAGLDLAYGSRMCRIRVRARDDRRLEYEIAAAGKSDLPTAAHLTLIPRMGKTIETIAGQKAKLGAEPIDWSAEQVGGGVTFAGYRLRLPDSASLHWPALPHNPYRKDGAATAAEGRIEIRIPFDEQHTTYTVTLEVN